MTRTAKTRSRVTAALIALVVSAAAAAALASPAAAANGSGEAWIKLAEHAKGRTLSGQGVKILAGTGASSADGKLSLPIGSLETGAGASAQTSAALSFNHGKQSLALTGIRFDLAKNDLVGTLDGRELAVFKLGGGASVDADGLSLQGGKLRLTVAGAKALKQGLGLERRLVRRGVGMVWLSARVAAIQSPAAETPVRPAARQVVAGDLDWGFLASWRGYVLSPPVGSAEVSEGATATGPLESPATTYGFPVGGGTYLAAAGSAPAELSVTTAGSVKWAKPGHGISEVRLSNLEVQIAPSGSWLIADVSTDFGAPAASEDVRFAALDPSAVTPIDSAGSVTWSGVPATLTAAGASSFAGFYEAGKQLEPVTITADLE